MDTKKPIVPVELDAEELAYANCLKRKLAENAETGKSSFRDFDTGCGHTIRVHQDGRVEHR